MVTLERNVGRLVEIRVHGAPSETDRRRFGAVIALANEVGPDAQIVLCSDMRQSTVGSAEHAAHMVQLVRATRGRVERAAVLLGDDKIVGMQVERVQSQVGHDARRIVHSVEEATEWLAPVLNAAEIARLKRFLGE